MKNPMRNFFQRVLWDESVDKRCIVVEFASRGSNTGVEAFTGEDVVKVTRDGLLVATGGKAKFIPFHRIIEIRYRDKVVFSKKESVYGFKI